MGNRAYLMRRKHIFDLFSLFIFVLNACMFFTNNAYVSLNTLPNLLLLEFQTEHYHIICGFEFVQDESLSIVLENKDEKHYFWNKINGQLCYIYTRLSISRTCINTTVITENLIFILQWNVLFHW